MFLDDLQFKTFTLIFFLKTASKPRTFYIFSKGPHFMLVNCKNVTLKVFLKELCRLSKKYNLVNFLKALQKLCKFE